MMRRNQGECDLYDICIVGDGIASAILADQLGQRNTCSVAWVKTPGSPSLETQNCCGETISVLPMFPVAGASLTSQLWLGDDSGLRSNVLDISYAEELKSSSAFHRSLSGKDSQAVLTWKLFGCKQDAPLPLEVKRKISRHYENGFATSVRYGFQGGISPYVRYVQQASLAPVAGPVTHLDLDRRRIRLATGRDIQFKALVWTKPLPLLLKHLGLGHGIDFHGLPTRFIICSTRVPIPENQLVYDCNQQSPIYRVFSPLENILVIQTSIHAATIAAASVSAAASRLLGIPECIVEKDIHVSLAYPLEFSPDEARHNIRSTLRDHGVFLFGRYATWEYLDLHELDWGVIDEVN